MLVIIIINIFGTCANSTYIINLLQEKLYIISLENITVPVIKLRINTYTYCAIK